MHGWLSPNTNNKTDGYKKSKKIELRQQEWDLFICRIEKRMNSNSILFRRPKLETKLSFWFILLSYFYLIKTCRYKYFYSYDVVKINEINKWWNWIIRCSIFTIIKLSIDNSVAKSVKVVQYNSCWVFQPYCLHKELSTRNMRRSIKCIKIKGEQL